MPSDLDDYEAAFDAARPPRDPELAWRRVERAVRRRSRGPTLDLVGALLGLAACVAVGLLGGGPGWGFAAFFLLVVVPERWRARRTWRAELAAVETDADLRALCKEQARARAGKAVASFVLLSLLALAYLAVALVAHLLGRSYLPGAVAALVVLAWAVLQLLVRLPLAAREAALLDGDD